MPEKRHILVVDDDDELRNALMIKLTEHGFFVLGCRKISEAVRMLSNQRFDCVLLDMHLEQGSGERVIAYMRADKAGFNFTTPILVVSGSLNPEIVQRIGQDVQGILVKPFSLKKITAKLQHFLPIDQARLAKQGNVEFGISKTDRKLEVITGNEDQFLAAMMNSISSANFLLDAIFEARPAAPEVKDVEELQLEKAIKLLEGVRFMFHARLDHLQRISATPGSSG